MTRSHPVLLLLVAVPGWAQLLGGPDSFDEVGEDFEFSSVWGRPASELPSLTTGDANPNGTAFVSAAAAHRGANGVRFQPAVRRRDSNGNPITGSALGPFLQFADEPASLIAPDAGLYFRTWVRVNTYPTSPLRPLILNFSTETGVTLEPSGAGWRARISTTGQLPTPVELMLPFTWHLIEAEYVRRPVVSGRSTGASVRIWLDGVLHATQPNITQMNTAVANGTVNYGFGIVEHLGGDLDGSIDYDDFRRSRRAPASQLTAQLEQSMPSVNCPDVRQIRVRLTSSQGTAAVAPYALQLELDAGPALAVGVLRNGCLDQGRPTIALGSDTLVVAIEGRSGGIVTASARDFLSARLNVFPLMVPDSGSPDAGTAFDAGSDAGLDAGVLDAGFDAGFDAGIDAGTDAGIDAGVDAGFDAGVPPMLDAGADGGAIDGGVDELGRPLLGCGVAQGVPVSMLWLALLFSGRRRKNSSPRPSEVS